MFPPSRNPNPQLSPRSPQPINIPPPSSPFASSSLPAPMNVQPYSPLPSSPMLAPPSPNTPYNLPAAPLHPPSPRLYYTPANSPLPGQMPTMPGRDGASPSPDPRSPSPLAAMPIVHATSNQYTQAYSGHYAVLPPPVHASVVSNIRYPTAPHPHTIYHPSSSQPSSASASTNSAKGGAKSVSAEAVTVTHAQITPQLPAHQEAPEEDEDGEFPPVPTDDHYPESHIDPPHSNHHTLDEEDDALQEPIDPTDLLGRLCSLESIKADDLEFWKKCMEGVEWTFYDNGSSEVQALVQRYCRNFVRHAARSRNFHALLLVICRHCENYSQTFHTIISTTTPSTVQNTIAGMNIGNITMFNRDHLWQTQLVYFLRLVLQYVLSNLSYDEILTFFQHLAIPDVASLPATPKSRLAGLGGHHTTASGGKIITTVPRDWEASSTVINLNPNSRRNSANSSVDILTRFVCAIVNMLEILGDKETNVLLSTHGKTARANTTSSKVPILDYHYELLNTLFVMLSTQMYLPLSTEYEQVFLDRLLYCAKPPLLHNGEYGLHGFTTGLISSFLEILPQNWKETLLNKREGGPLARGTAGGPPVRQRKKSFLGQLTEKMKNILLFPVWAVKYIFTIPPNHPVIDRSILLLELLVYQNSENEFRDAVRGLKNDEDLIPVNAQSSTNTTTSSSSSSTLEPSLPPTSSDLSLSSSSSSAHDSTPSKFNQITCGRINFTKLYYSLCATLSNEHINLFLYTLIHENASFTSYLLSHHQSDLDYLLMPQLEILYKEIDISKHHVYMIINIWILLTSQKGFHKIIKELRIKDVTFYKEMQLKDITLCELMQIILLRTLQLNLRTKLKEPHIFNNCLAAFCNLTITAIQEEEDVAAPSSAPSQKVLSRTTSSSSSVNGNGNDDINSGEEDSTTTPSPLLSSIDIPLQLHPQVSFRLVRILTILHKQFLVLIQQQEQHQHAHQQRLDVMEQEERVEYTEQEETEVHAYEQVNEELSTCMEFMQLLLEVVNHGIVHIRRADPTEDSFGSASSSRRSSVSPIKTSLSLNPSLLYNLLHSQATFQTLLPYSDHFESHLLTNICDTIQFYIHCQGLDLPTNDNGVSNVTAGSGAQMSKSEEKSVAKNLAILEKAIENTPVRREVDAETAAESGVPSQAYLSPAFNLHALIERGSFTYLEQENSQDFFIPYIYQLAQNMSVLPKMYIPGQAVPSNDTAAHQQALLQQQQQAFLEQQYDDDSPLPMVSGALLLNPAAAGGEINADDLYAFEVEQERRVKQQQEQQERQEQHALRQGAVSLSLH